VDAGMTLVHPAPAPSATDRVPLVDVRNLVKHFPVKGGVLQRTMGWVKAVESVSFTIYRGETLGLVGESGCGKTTVGRLLLRLIDPTGGEIRFQGPDGTAVDLTTIKGRALKPFRRRMQIIFQDPFASLDPRSPIGDSIGDGLRIHATRENGWGSADARRQKVLKMMDMVGLASYHYRRYPHEFSGGQRQRIGIARALVLEPDLVVCDEPVSALDVSIQAQIVNLLLDLQAEFGLSYLFISHDMAVVERVSHRVAVMYLGQIVEIGPRRAIFENPQHPYTRKLMAAVPVADPARRRRKRELSSDEIPSPIRAVGDEPVVAPLSEVAPGHFVATHRIAGAY
jgi:glutathione transport system ATP-binding protein